jgi:hypothetical protein
VSKIWYTSCSLLDQISNSKNFVRMRDLFLVLPTFCGHSSLTHQEEDSIKLLDLSVTEETLETEKMKLTSWFTEWFKFVCVSLEDKNKNQLRELKSFYWFLKSFLYKSFCSDLEKGVTLFDKFYYVSYFAIFECIVIFSFLYIRGNFWRGFCNDRMFANIVKLS